MTDVATESKKITATSGQHYTCAQVGKFADLRDYAFTIQDKVRRGKVFIKDAAQFTAMEVSFTSIPAGKNTPYVHHHKQDEEAYIFISGIGRMQVDDDIFDVSEGTVVRVATPGKRAIGNNSDAPLV